MHQNGKTPKTRWSGFLTVQNYDWLCHIAIVEDRSMANVINRIIALYRREEESSTGNEVDAKSNQK